MGSRVEVRDEGHPRAPACVQGRGARTRKRRPRSGRGDPKRGGGGGAAPGGRVGSAGLAFLFLLEFGQFLSSLDFGFVAGTRWNEDSDKDSALDGSAMIGLRTSPAMGRPAFEIAEQLDAYW